MRKKNGTNKDLEASAARATAAEGDNRKRLQEKLLVMSQKEQVRSKSKTQQQDSPQPPPSASSASDEMEFKNNSNNFKKTWLLILLPMTIALVLAATLIVILILPTLLEVDDKCFNSFQETNYKLFATKTTYTSATDYLNQSSPAGASHQQPSVFLQTSGRRQSLEELNNFLTISHGCKLRQLHYIGRHAARYPSTKDILQINKLIESVQNRIEPSKYNSNNNNNANNANNNSNLDQPPTKVCLNPLAEFKSWASPLIGENGNLVTDFGILETRALAERFRAIYPTMFDAREAKVEFGVTKELRTAQTALIFKDLLVSPNSGSEASGSPPRSADSLPAPAFIRDIRHLEDFVSKNRAQKLEFHEKCKSYHKDEFQLAHNFSLYDENRIKFISVSISKKLKLNKEEFLSKDETDAIYDMCKYETALSADSSRLPSIWCNLFSESQLKFYEYLNDVEKFYKVYGHPDQARSACPVTTDLMKSFKSLLNQQAPETVQFQSAQFYFTHSQVIQKILANLIELESDSAYSAKNVKAHLNAGTVPETRDWQTSLLSPFSANIAFTAYECPSTATSAGASLRPEIKIITSVNERPILIDGCDEIVCPLDRILDDAKINKEKRCKLEEICRKKIVTT